jgi:hypothetical protein
MDSDVVSAADRELLQSMYAGFALEGVLSVGEQLLSEIKVEGRGSESGVEARSRQ